MKLVRTWYMRNGSC